MNRNLGGYRACRPSYLGTKGELFVVSKAPKAADGVVRVDMNGRRHIITKALNFPAYDQESLGSCEANAAAGGLVIASGLDINPSRRHLYILCLMYDRSYPNDTGTWGETVHRVLLNEGVCSEKACPYTDDPDTWYERPSIEALQEGYDHRIDATFRIGRFGGTLCPDIRASVDAGRPVQIGGPVTRRYEEYFEGLHGGPTAFTDLSPSIGGHAQLIVGYWEVSPGVFWYLVRNSWGTGGGLREFPGHAWYSELAIVQQDEHFSFYKR